ncbi:hypothetical protein [Aeromonas sp. sia0103]|uniref:hypothetical protein n=1 Tax=Aeromonas sp. sia0103 TaxID=2854782 RepID=UPI001C485A62|nr:hypothetical protein [Aeromonas sp. sia0103]MBV7598371.1 hypothetical protein [Aeromonas sp. sia0103]
MGISPPNAHSAPGRGSEIGAITLLSAVLLNCHGESGKGKPMVARADKWLAAL